MVVLRVEAQLHAPGVILVRREDLDGGLAKRLGLASRLSGLVDDSVNAIAACKRLHLDMATPCGRLPHSSAVLFELLLQERLEVGAVRLHEVDAALADGSVLINVARDLVSKRTEQASPVGLDFLEHKPAGLHEVLFAAENALPALLLDQLARSNELAPELRLFRLWRLVGIQVHGLRLLLPLARKQGTQICRWLALVCHGGGALGLSPSALVADPPVPRGPH
mmetsp:Transcript_37976/g.98286  ORF Transcript_37976/g.98286 Transcript_37976/m.98286 type:complete len:223 (+) Transcript_37976:252-920(+)